MTDANEKMNQDMAAIKRFSEQAVTPGNSPDTVAKAKNLLMNAIKEPEAGVESALNVASELREKIQNETDPAKKAIEEAQRALIRADINALSHQDATSATVPLPSPDGRSAGGAKRMV